MKKNIYILVTALYLCACDVPSSSQSKNNTAQAKEVNKKEEFTKLLDILSEDEKLNQYLSEIKFSSKELVDYCRKSGDPQLIAKLVKAVYLNVDNNKKAAKDNFWSDIRYDLYQFTDIVTELKEEDHKTFLDIGCGSGQKLYAALCLGFEKAYGLEYSEKSVRFAKSFLGDYLKDNSIEIMQGDALTVDTAYYNQADFLYTYSPMKDNDMMAQLFHRAMKSLKEGGIMLEVRLVYYKELKKLSGYDIPPHKNWFAVKKEKGKYYYKNIHDNYEWNLLEKL